MPGRCESILDGVSVGKPHYSNKKQNNGISKFLIPIDWNKSDLY